MKNKALAMAIDITLILIGTFLMGLAYNVFLVPNMISPSGFAGLSSLVTYLSKQTLASTSRLPFCT